MSKVRERREVRGRAGRAKPRTISSRKLSDEEVRTGIDLDDWRDHERPRNREMCRDGLRPCPFVGCRYNLYLDVKPGERSIKLNFPDLQVWEIPISCALDVAECGKQTLELVGSAMNLTRERVRQVARDAAKRVRGKLD